MNWFRRWRHRRRILKQFRECLAYFQRVYGPPAAEPPGWYSKGGPGL